MITRCCWAVRLCLTVCDPVDCSSQSPLPSTVYQSLLKFMFTESLIWSNHLIFCHLLLFLPSVFPSIRIFSSVNRLFASGSQSIGASASASVLPINIESISFRIDWLDLLAVQGALQCLLQHHTWKALVVLVLLYLMLQLSCDHWKNHSFDYTTFVVKVTSLFFNMLSKFVIAFLPRNKHLFISWLQSTSTVCLEPQKRKSVPASTFPPSICLEVVGLKAMILVCLMLNFKPAFSLSLFTLIERLFSSSLLSAIRVVSSEYLRLLLFFLAILIPACDSSRPAFHMMSFA